MIRWVFPSAGGVLDPKALMKNPSKPSNLQMQQASAEYFRVFLRLKASDDNDAAVKYEPADLWHLGKDAPEAQKPLYKNMKASIKPKPGWYALVPLSAKYEVEIQNKAPFPVEVRLQIDGRSDDPMVIPSMDSSVLSDILLIETKAERSAAFDASSAGKIVVQFRKIKDVQKVDAHVPRSTSSAQPRDLVVNEADKNNMTFQALSLPPKFNPDILFDYEYMDPSEPLYTDDALPDGCLTLNYRTNYWFQSAGWISSEHMTLDITNEDDEVQVTMAKMPPPRPTKQSKLVRFLNRCKTPLAKQSKIKDFFEALSRYDEQRPWTPAEVQSVVQALRKDFVDTTQQLKDIEEGEWYGIYLAQFPKQDQKRVWLIIQEAIVWIVEGRHFVALDDD